VQVLFVGFIFSISNKLSSLWKHCIYMMNGILALTR